MNTICVLVAITQVKASDAYCALNKADHPEHDKSIDAIPETVWQSPTLHHEADITNNSASNDDMELRNLFKYYGKRKILIKLFKTETEATNSTDIEDTMIKFQRLKAMRWKNNNNYEKDFVTRDTRRQAKGETTETTTIDASKEMRDIMSQMEKDHGTTTTRDPTQYRFTRRSTTASVRTTISRLWLDDHCDYIAYYCMAAYATGRVCARTQLFLYYTFKNYCMMEYVNCVETFDIWTPIHMGPCFDLGVIAEHKNYNPDDSKYLYTNLAQSAIQESQFGLRPTHWRNYV